MGKMGLRDQNKGKKIGINGSRIYHVTTLDWGMVRDNDKGAWTDEGVLSSDAREYINSESEIMCCLLKMTCCEHK